MIVINLDCNASIAGAQTRAQLEVWKESSDRLILASPQKINFFILPFAVSMPLIIKMRD